MRRLLDFSLASSTLLVLFLLAPNPARAQITAHIAVPAGSPADQALNDIGAVTLRTSVPLAFDPYTRNRRTGSFILIDESSNATVGAGMITAAI